MKKILPLLIILFTYTASFAQVQKVNDYKKMVYEPGANFFEIVEETRAQIKLLESTLPNTGKENEQFRELKAQFERWVWNTEGKVGRDGKLAPSAMGWQNYLAQNPGTIFKQEKKSRSAATWTNYSPFTGFYPNDSTHANGWTYGYGIGRINVVRQAPSNKSLYYAGGAMGGVFVSNNSGNSWIPTTDQFSGLGISDLIINPANNNTLLIATGDYDGSHINTIGIFKSIDGGATWVNKFPVALTGNQQIAHVKYDPTNMNVLLATSTNAILKSIDGGETWTPSHTVANARFNDIVFISGTEYYVSGRAGRLYRTINSGTAWDTIATGKTERIDMDYNTTSGLLYFLATSNPAFRTYNTITNSWSTPSWNAITTTNGVSLPDLYAYNSQQGYNQVITVNPTNANEIVVGEFNAKRSIDGGATWLDFLNGYWDPNDPQTTWGGVYVHSDYHFVEFIPGTDSLLLGNDGGAYVGSIALNTWPNLYNGLIATQSYSMAISQSAPEAFLFGNQDNDGYSRANNAGYKWYMAQAGDGTATGIDPANENNRLLGGTEGKLKRRTDGFSASAFGTSIQPTGSKANFVFPMETHPDGNLFYVGYDEIRKYNFATNSWTALTDPNDTAKNIDKIELSNNTATTSKIYVMSGGDDQYKLYRSADENTYTVVPDPSASQFNQNMCCSKTNWDSLFVCAKGYAATDKVWMSADGGATYTNITYNMPNIQMVCLELKQGSDTLFVGTELGLYYLQLSTGATPGWQKYGAGLPNVKITDIEINYVAKKMYVATYGRGAWFIDFGNAPLSLNDLIFTSEKVSNRDNTYTLSWSTNQKDVEKIELQKSTDAQYFTTVFTANNNFANTQQYNVVLKSNEEYYRLQLTGLNNASTYSTVIPHSMTDGDNVFVYPNPARDVLNIQSPETIRFVRITDLYGNQIAAASPNNNTYTLQLDFLPSGNYLVDVFTKYNKSVTKKISVIK